MDSSDQKKKINNVHVTFSAEIYALFVLGTLVISVTIKYVGDAVRNFK